MRYFWPDDVAFVRIGGVGCTVDCTVNCTVRTENERAGSNTRFEFLPRWRFYNLLVGRQRKCVVLSNAKNGDIFVTVEGDSNRRPEKCTSLEAAEERVRALVSEVYRS